MAASNVRYEVSKVTTVKRVCPCCNGTKVYHGRKCGNCIEGIAAHTVTTSVSLIDALIDLGLVKNPAAAKAAANNQSTHEKPH